MRRAVGEGVEPSRSAYSCYQEFRKIFATATRRCVCHKFHHPTVCKSEVLSPKSEVILTFDFRLKTLDLNLLLGKGSNLQGVVGRSCDQFPMLSATGTRRCVCQKFHHPTMFKSDQRTVCLSDCLIQI